MTAEQNKSLFRSIITMWQTGDLSQVDELTTPDYIGHVSFGDRDRDGLKARIKTFLSMYPDIIFTIEDQMTDGDKVITRLSAHGTNSGTGQITRLIGINISRIINGKIAEEWATWEMLLS